jgi:hypothetical protein
MLAYTINVVFYDQQDDALLFSMKGLASADKENPRCREADLPLHAGRLEDRH